MERRYLALPLFVSFASVRDGAHHFVLARQSLYHQAVSSAPEAIFVLIFIKIPDFSQQQHQIQSEETIRTLAPSFHVFIYF